MTRARHLASLLATAVVFPGIAHAQQPLAFVTCPIVRDTKNVPCWLVEHQGELYYLGIQVDSTSAFRPPLLGHKVLVEGTPSEKERICGGIPLEPLQTSPLPELAPECNTMLPAEERYDLPFEPPRPPGPGRRPLVFIPPQEKPEPPFVARAFDVPYDFDALVDSRHSRWLRNIATYARDIGASSISIAGIRSATDLTDGGQQVEQAGIGERRARQLAELLQGGGLTGPRYELSWTEEPVTGNPAPRVVHVVVSP